MELTGATLRPTSIESIPRLDQAVLSPGSGCCWQQKEAQTPACWAPTHLSFCLSIQSSV